MNTSQDDSARIIEQLKDANKRGAPVEIVAGGTKRFYGRRPWGEPLSVKGHRGVVAYEPEELVVTARSATPLSELEAALGERGQMLAFEPPHFGDAATLGGVVACGFSGPRRPYIGSARDFVLGVRCISGQGEVLRFGGQVMKNVAGYDIPRLMAGAMGTLGVLLDISLKVLPKPEAELTLVFDTGLTQAVDRMNAWAGSRIPLSATCYYQGQLWARLSGTDKALKAAHRHLGGELFEDTGDFWWQLSEHQHRFFADDQPLWRLSLPPAAPQPALEAEWLLEWGGAQRWLKTGAPNDHVRQAAAGLGGHATLFRGGDRSGEVFQRPDSVVMVLHRRLKRAFDPADLLNRGRLYTDLAATSGHGERADI